MFFRGLFDCHNLARRVYLQLLVELASFQSRIWCPINASFLRKQLTQFQCSKNIPAITTDFTGCLLCNPFKKKSEYANINMSSNSFGYLVIYRSQIKTGYTKSPIKKTYQIGLIFKVFPSLAKQYHFGGSWAGLVIQLYQMHPRREMGKIDTDNPGLSGSSGSLYAGEGFPESMQGELSERWYSLSGPDSNRGSESIMPSDQLMEPSTRTASSPHRKQL